MYKVTLEITNDYYEWTVWNDDKPAARGRMVRVRGGARSTEKASIFEDAVESIKFSERLVEGMEDGDPYGIMMGLCEVNDIDPHDWDEETDDQEGT